MQVESFKRFRMKHDQPEPGRAMPEGGNSASRTWLAPVLVRARHISIERHHRDYVRGKLGRKLEKFAPVIERIAVRFDDVHGDKGGPDRRCKIHVSLRGMGSVIVEESSLDPIAAFDLAETRVMLAIEHRLGRVRDGHVHAAMRAHEAERDALVT